MTSMYKDLYFNDYFFESEIVENIFISICLKHNVQFKKDTISNFKEIVNESYEKDNLIYLLELAKFYGDNAQYFMSIGDPDLPLWDGFHLEDSCLCHAFTLMYSFNDSGICPIKVPNILGFCEEVLEPDKTSLDDMLQYNLIDTDSCNYTFSPYSQYTFSNTFLFSEDIDIAIQHGYSDEIIENIISSFSLNQCGDIIRAEIVPNTSPLHLKNIQNRRLDLKKDNPDYFNRESIRKGSKCDYNIILTLVEDSDSYYGTDYVSLYDGIECLESFIKLSQLLLNIQKDVLSH